MRPPERAFRFACAAAFAVASCSWAAPQTAIAQDPFADAVESFVPGAAGGFGATSLPEIVLGPPHGTGLLQGSFDVVALGVGGSITLRFDEPVICDGPGVDFTVFENAFYSGSPSGPIFDELAFVSVSQDGETFHTIPYDAESHAGLAGRSPVLSHPDNGIDPLDPGVSGGDSFDLAEVGLPAARYVRLTDVAGEIPDTGDLPPFLPPPHAGFDLDAVAAVHSCDGPATPTPTSTSMEPTATASPAPPSATPVASATRSATAAPPTPFPEATATPATPPEATATPWLRGDVDGDGAVDGADVGAVVREIFDGDPVADLPADVNEDLRITAADVVAVAAQRTE